MKYTAHLLGEEKNTHSFLACLAQPPDLPGGVTLSHEVEPYAVLLMHRTDNGFKWAVFDGDVADWKEPIGQLLLDEKIPVGKWVWMELRTDAQQNHTTTELATLRAKAEAWDKGGDVWAVVTKDGIAVYIGTRRQCIKLSKEYNESSIFQDGYTCRKVRVCEEVEG